MANVDAATKSAGRQKRDVSDTMMVGQLKKKAANLMNDVKDKQGKWRDEHSRLVNVIGSNRQQTAQKLS